VKKTRAKITGFNPEHYAGKRVEEVPLSLISAAMAERKGYRSPNRVRLYTKMVKNSKPPPIELILTVSVDGRPLKKPFYIYNGGHRYGAAVLAGCETIPAVVAWIEKEGTFDEEEYETDETNIANAERFILWAEEAEIDEEMWNETDES